MRQIVLDTETTGLSAEAGDRIIEIGCVELLNRKLTGNNFHYYLNPDREIHEDAKKVHGISNEFLSDKPRFENIVDDFLSYIQGAQIIIHNAPFDVGFLNAELKRLEKVTFNKHVNGVLDTLAMAKELYPGKRNSLDALCERLGVSNAARTLHGALLDAELLADVYIHLTRGQNALLMDGDHHSVSHQNTLAIDYAALVLPVIQPNVEELTAHEEVLAQIDKASDGKTLWRALTN
jgi:DNA polymerase-3 subunit epsilon